MRIDWSRRSLADLEAVFDHIAKNSEHYARGLIEKLTTAVDPLAQFPRLGRRIPEARDPSDELRELLVGQYRVMYHVEAERILVLAVVHGSRDLEGAETPPWEEQIETDPPS